MFLVLNTTLTKLYNFSINVTVYQKIEQNDETFERYAHGFFNCCNSV